MNTLSLFPGLVELVALLAVEVGLVLLAVALLAWRTRSASWRRAFWQAGLIGALVITGCELSGAGREIAGWVLDGLARPHADPATPAPQAQAPPPQLRPEFRSKVESWLAARRQAAVRPEPSAQLLRWGDVSTTARPGGPAEDPRPAHNPAPTVDLSTDLFNVLLLWVIWGTGTVVVAARAGLGRCLLVVFRRRRRPVTDPMLLARARGLTQALGMRRRIRLVESDSLHSPIAFGLSHPTVGLPRDFSLRFTPARQDAMLAHELAHLAAQDPAWSLLADFCAALLWWHPAVWWARRELHLASELAADEASLLLEDGPTVLAECLLELGSRLASYRALGQLEASGFRSHLGRRIQRLVHLDAHAWSSPPRRRTVLLLALGPLAMAALVVLCTAWVTPWALTKGNDMQSMPLTLKHSLATLALLVTFAGPDQSISAVAPGQPPADPVPPVVPATVTTPAANVPAAAVQATAAENRRPLAPPSPEQEQFLRRYGLMPGPGGMAPGPINVPTQSPKRQKIETKLDEITLPEIHFDGLPLNEVLAALSEQAVRLDPDRKGINFLLNANNPPAVGLSSIDPATGLPSTAPAEPIDVGAILVKFSLPLRNVTLQDTLEAIVRVAERPLEYSVEDYGVVVSLKAEAALSPPVQARVRTAGETVVACTYKVDTNTFLAGLENAFGISVPRAATGPSSAPAREVQIALTALLTQLGVRPADAKAVFYNDLTGMVMVRATEAEQGVIQAAIETLGGSLAGSYGPSGGGGGYPMAMPGGRYRR